MTPDQLKEKHPLVYRVFFTDELDFKPRSLPGDGYKQFQQMGLKLRAKKALTDKAKESKVRHIGKRG